MGSFEEALDQISWDQFSLADGLASDIPFYLFALLSDDVEEQDEALQQLRSLLNPHGIVLEVSCIAIPFLIQILQKVSQEQKASLISFLDSLAQSSIYADRNLVRLEMDGPNIDPPRKRQQHWKPVRQFLQEGNEYQPPQWMQEAHKLVGEGMPTYLHLLASSNLVLLGNTLALLKGFQEWNNVLVPAITTLFIETSDTIIKAQALDCLSALLDEQAPEWSYFHQILYAPSIQVDLEVRKIAAQGLALHHSGEHVAAITDVISEAMLTPLPHLKKSEFNMAQKGHAWYWVDCEPFSYLGLPNGLLGLLHIFEKGASKWSILDTIRVAEAVLDLAFFGGWVKNRDWTFFSRELSPTIFAELEHQDGVTRGSYSYQEIPKLNQEYAYFHFNYSPSRSSQLPDFLIQVWGYDEVLASALKMNHEQEGLVALSDTQIQTLQMIVDCEPLWKITHNLMVIYGLPLAQKALKRFLAK